MELAAEKANFDGVRTQLLFAIEELDLPHFLPLSDISGQAHELSPPWSAPVPCLQGSPNSTSSRDHEPKPEESKCAYCGKVFKTNKAKYGHMRIHGDRSSLKLKGTLESTADFNINSCGSIKRKRMIWKQMIEKNTPEAVAAAFILMEMSRSKSNGSYMESNIPLDLDEKKHMHMHASETCNTTFPSQQALVEHRSSHKKNGEVQKSTNRKRKRKVKSESGSHSHVCEVCKKSYPTGHQLGGHMRAHQKKDPSPINEQVPNGGEAALLDA